MATTPPDPSLAAELEAFARRKAGVGAWAGAAWALVEASRLSSDREQRERLLLKAVDAMIGAGDLIQADAFAQEVVGFAPAAMGDATMGYLAVLRGRPGDAEKLLQRRLEVLRQHRRCDAGNRSGATARIARGRTAAR